MIRFSLLPSHPKHLHVHLLGIGIVELALAQLAVEADDLAEFVLHLLNVFHTDRCHFRLLQLKRGGKERNSHRKIQRTEGTSRSRYSTQKHSNPVKPRYSVFKGTDLNHALY